ncbi:GFA family protein [Maricaulis sp.]|uniref:GFA family protein n=1 Tax=Maricaulis sp. TaxID=1486257 RepID=UPI002620DF90|nr:GFA family protein [Maricaulis sp.]
MAGTPEKSWRSGGCHCGAVRFEVNVTDAVVVISCNCSLCAKTGFIHLVVDEADFRVTQGEDNIGEYSFHTHTARHRSCRTCHVTTHHTMRSRPDGISVNLRCLDGDANLQLRFQEFDGASWDEDGDMPTTAANQA